MKYQVDITRQAELEIEQIYLRAHRAAPMTAARWYQRLEQAIYSLEDMPDRCPLAPEGVQYTLPIRQLIFGKRSGALRILFIIESSTVTVLHCVRAAKHYLSQDDLKH